MSTQEGKKQLTANSIKANLQILVDADSCPVKAEILRVAQEYNLKVVMVASIAHYSVDQDTNWVYVDSSFQAVDMAIANRLNSGDIVVTQDYGLAALVLAKEGQAISPRGMIYRPDEMLNLLEQRNALARQRRGGFKTKGPSKLTAEDQQNFVRNFRLLVTKGSSPQGKQEN